MPTPTMINGEPVGPGTPYDLDWRAGSEYAWSADLSFAARAADFPLYQGYSLQPAVRIGRIKPGDTAPANYDEWRENVLRIFRPGGDVKTLVADHRGEAVDLPVVIARLAHREETPMRGDLPSLFDVTLVAPSPAYRKTTPLTDSVTAGGTSTLSVGGNYPASPIVTVTPTATGRRVRALFAERTTRGLMNYTVMVSGLDTTGVGATTPNKMTVFHNKAPINFLALDMNTINTKVFFLISVKGSGETFADICFASDIDNQVTAQAFNPGGFWLDHADFSNAAWVWRSTSGTVGGVPAPSLWEMVGKAPNRAGAWRAIKLGNHPQGSSYQLTTAADRIEISVSSDSVLRNDADAIVMTAQVEAAASNGLTGISAVSTLGGGFPTSFTPGTLRFMLPGDGLWQDAADDNPADIDGSIQEAIVATKAEFIPPSSPYSDVNFTLTIAQDGAGPIKRAFDATKIPTITLDDPVDIAVLNGDIENVTAGRTINFRNLIVDVADGVVVDCLSEKIDPIEAVHYWPNPNEGIRFSYEADIATQGLWPFIENTDNEWTSPWPTSIELPERIQA